MKKLLTIIFTFCFLTTIICIFASAEKQTKLFTPKEGTVMRVCGQKDDSLELIGDFDVLEKGWNAAMRYAMSASFMNDCGYSRIVVDLLKDWDAVDGQFTEEWDNGEGFNWDAIYFQPDVKITLNLNGHTINRGLSTWEYNGEVIYIDSDADVIINNGKITGGYSCNGAGGIHINSGANVVLNNVNITKNYTEDDDGAGIALHGGSTLTMNGGSLVENKCYESGFGGGIAVSNSEATLKNVLICDNAVYSGGYTGSGVVASGGGCYVFDGTLNLSKCTIKNNYSERYGGGIGTFAGSVVVAEDCIITGNQAEMDGAAIALVSRGECYITGGSATGNKNNKMNSIFYGQYGTFHFSNVEYDNQIRNICGNVFVDNGEENPTEQPGSIFGGGSVSMIISLVALAVSAATAVTVIVNAKKKNPRPVLEGEESAESAD